MESKVARESHEALIAAIRQLTPEERLQAFLRHCRLMTALHRAGQSHSSERELKP